MRICVLRIFQTRETEYLEEELDNTKKEIAEKKQKLNKAEDEKASQLYLISLQNSFTSFCKEIKYSSDAFSSSALLIFCLFSAISFLVLSNSSSKVLILVCFLGWKILNTHTLSTAYLPFEF
jgi:hypothetical protein